jgi:peptide/nickel transport system permease protein
MKAYIIRRLAWGIVAICVITCLNFLIIKMVPGDPVRAMIGDYPVPQDYIDNIRRQYGLDQPLYIQFWRYISALVQGDFGYSFSNRHAVLPLILERAKYTLLLIIPAILFSLVVGIALAAVSARRPNGVVDNSISGIVILGYSVPSFWLGQLLVLFFAVLLVWLPAAGMTSLRVRHTGWALVWDVWLHMIMPLICIITFKLAIFLRVARASIIGVANDDFVTTARAKGMSERRIMWTHILPNAMIPVIAVLGYQFGHALTSSILVETVFAWPGVGQLFVSAIASRDFPVLQGILVLATTLVVLANFIADLLSALVDPRIRRNLGARHG